MLIHWHMSLPIPTLLPEQDTEIGEEYLLTWISSHTLKKVFSNGWTTCKAVHYYYCFVVEVKEAFTGIHSFGTELDFCAILWQGGNHNGVDIPAHNLRNMAGVTAWRGGAGVVGVCTVQVSSVEFAGGVPVHPDGIFGHPVQLHAGGAAGTLHRKKENAQTSLHGSCLLWEAVTKQYTHWKRSHGRCTQIYALSCWWPPETPYNLCRRWCIPSGSVSLACGIWHFPQWCQGGDIWLCSCGLRPGNVSHSLSHLCHLQDLRATRPWKHRHLSPHLQQQHITH